MAVLVPGVRYLAANNSAVDITIRPVEAGFEAIVYCDERSAAETHADAAEALRLAIVTVTS